MYTPIIKAQKRRVVRFPRFPSVKPLRLLQVPNDNIENLLPSRTYPQLAIASIALRYNQTGLAMRHF